MSKEQNTRFLYSFKEVVFLKCLEWRALECEHCSELLV